VIFAPAEFTSERKSSYSGVFRATVHFIQKGHEVPT
jgi:hypothetical protein